MNRLTSAFGDWMAAKVKKDKTPLVKCQTIDAARSANVKKGCCCATNRSGGILGRLRHQRIGCMSCRACCRPGKWWI
jgi:hypothetical protein